MSSHSNQRRSTYRAEPPVRPKHATHTLEREDGHVRFVCTCGVHGVWYRDDLDRGVGQATSAHGIHSRGLGAR